MENAQDKKNKRIAFLVSLGLHAGLFLTFFFLISWRAPYPPAPEYGVVLNYGLDNQGGGEIQPETPVGDSKVDDKSEEMQADEKKLQDEPIKDVAQKEEVKEEKKDADLSDENSDVTVKTEKKKIEDKSSDKVDKVEPKNEVKAKEKKVVKKEAVYPSNSGAKKGETNQSQGDDGKVGDKGNPQGKLDAKALYGKPGGGGGGDGFGLAMSGWEWANKPKIPDLPDNEEGRIVFVIECDEDGEIVAINTEERGLSAKAEQLLKDEIRKNSLQKTSNGTAPSRSKGRVVFVLKTK